MYFKVSKITIIFLFCLLLLFLSPFKTVASNGSDPSITYYLSGNDMQTLYLPGPSKVYKVNVLACSDQNRNGGFQLGIALLYGGSQVAYQGTLRYARSGCPMWSYGGTAESTALDFGGISADAVRIIPILGTGTYYQLYVTYEEGYVPPMIQCGAENTIAEYFNFSVPWCQQGDFRLPAPVKIHLVNLYGCCDQNRGGGCSDGIALLYQGTQVAYIGRDPWARRCGDVLTFARSGCPMWSHGQSPTACPLNFGGVLADTIRAVPTGRCGAAIYRIFYTHEAPECNQVNNAACIGINAPDSVAAEQPFNASVTMNNNGTKPWTTDATPHRLGSQNPQDNLRWGLNRISLPWQPVNPGQSVTFSFSATAPSSPGTYSFDWKMVEDGIEWFGATCQKTITVTPKNNPPSANNLKATQLDYCNIGWAHAIFSWTFTDPDGDSQSAYQIQVDNNSDFSSLETFTGKTPCTSPCSYATLPGDLSWNTTYYWQLTVWDSKDRPSADWIVYQNNVPPPESFGTPLHAYPVAKYPTWTPLNPSAKETVTFYPPDQPVEVVPTWSWNIPDAIYVGGTNSASKNPQVQFNSAGAHTVSLTVTDAPPHSSYSCLASVTINLQLPLPEWKEIPPF